jgi:long-chain acyl-CoA synthetase
MSKVLITGATGFIGGELLKRMIKRETRAIVCLVRAKSPAEAAARGETVLEGVFGRAAPKRLAARIEWVAGDVERPRLGLDEATWAGLAADLEEVYHCAASTSFDQTYEDARRINFVGVQGIVELVEAAVALGGGRFRRLHHVSTAYVAGKTPGDVEAGFLPEDDASLFRNTYERTKAQAERYLRERMDRLPVTIYRPSIVVGDSRSGKTSSWNVVYYPMRLMAWGRLPFASHGGRSLLDVVPVDHVVESILALGRREDTRGETYHLTAGEDALTVQDVIDHTYAGLSRRRGREVEVGTTALGPLAWSLLTSALRLFGSAKTRKALDGFDVYVDYTRCETSFSTLRERALLASEGVASPEPQEFFPRIVDYALAENFGKPLPARTAPAKDTVRSVPRPTFTLVPVPVMAR